MSFEPDKLPDEIRNQKGLRYRQPTEEVAFKNRRVLTRAYLEHSIDIGKRPTVDDVLEFLKWLDRGYSLDRRQISLTVTSFQKDGRMDRYPNGHQVRIGKQTFASKREAARALGVAPQTVKNRIASTDPKWAEWSET